MYICTYLSHLVCSVVVLYLTVDVVLCVSDAKCNLNDDYLWLCHQFLSTSFARHFVSLQKV